MERIVTHLSHPWQTRSLDGGGESTDREGERNEGGRQWSYSRETLARLLPFPSKKKKGKIWNEMKDKGKQRESVVWNTKEWSEDWAGAAVGYPLGIGEWGREERRRGVRFCYFSFSWSIWFATPCGLNTLLLSSSANVIFWAQNSHIS